MGIQDGLDYLIDAARVIIADWWREDIQFVLVGSGPELPRLRERARPWAWQIRSSSPADCRRKTSVPYSRQQMSV